MGRVLITGIGTVSPLGLDAPTTWQAMLEGSSGIDTIAAFDPSPFPVRIAGEVRGFDPEKVVSRKDARRMDRSVLLAVAAADEAVTDAGLEVTEPERAGVVVGSAIGGVALIEEQQRLLMEKGPGRVSPSFLPNALVDTATSYIATRLGAIGCNFAVVSACATGSHAIGVGAELIQDGRADVVIAGGTEACVTPLVLAGFCQMQALAPRNDEPRAASRPFDRGRSGFVVAEGAGIVVLESASHARARGAKVYAEMAGYGASNDAYHVATPHPGSRGVIRMFQDALDSARVRPEEVGYINTHGTGTPLGDPAETRAIREVFGVHADRLAASSTKSMTGHLFGAAGALEAIATALALRDQVLPPTINLEDPDPACDLDYVPLKSREATLDVAISNSMGLGGHNGAVVLRRAAP
ncbi:MAG TPA: beta-ketoacyl-ACP synthase II [Actinomycetes bacterium]|jgi:3-oxoacyl-[acyl-carrier-protein] synthase II|nr:beta-ketoacyl-ACP synthase II [Actinomycetes bacterium]